MLLFPKHSKNTKANTIFTVADHKLFHLNYLRVVSGVVGEMQKQLRC